MVDPTQAPVPDASGSAGGAVEPAASEEAHHAPGLTAPRKEVPEARRPGRRANNRGGVGAERRARFHRGGGQAALLGRRFG